MNAAPTFDCRVAEVDAIAAAERIERVGNARHQAIGTTTVEIVALARRLLALEDLAATAYQLLAHTDELDRVRGQVPALREQALRESASALSGQLGEQLAALGYSHPEPESQQEIIHAEQSAHA